MTRQRADCEELAEHRGWEVVETFEDNDTGAWNGRARPAYTRLLQAIREGHVDAVVAWHADRLHRHPRELEEFIELCDQTGVLLATCTGDLDLATDDGRLFARIQGAVARKESDDKSRRLKRMHEELAKQGRWIGGGGRPFGYDLEGGRKSGGGPATLRIRQDEARHIRKAVRRVLAGTPIYRITSEWNDAGIVTPNAKRWALSRVRALLLSPHIAGLRVHRRTGLVRKAEWPGIISSAQHELLKIRLDGPSRARRASPGPRKYVLSGLAVCGLCGQRLVGSSGSYRCAVISGGCGRVGIAGRATEDEVFSAAYAAWSQWEGPDPASEVPPEPPTEAEEELLVELHELEARLDKLAEDYADGKLRFDTRRYNVASGRLRSRIEDIEGELARRLPQPEQRPPLSLAELARRAAEYEARRERGELSALEVQRDHEWVAAFVQKIVIHPASKRGRGFDPIRIQLEWVPGREPKGPMIIGIRPLTGSSKQAKRRALHR